MTSDNITPGLRIAALQTINPDLLCSGNEGEINKLLRAAILDGVFYLDLRCDLGEQNAILDTVEQIYGLSQDLFGLDENEKLQYDVDTLPGLWSNLKLCGYKPIGRNVGGLKNNRDGFESFAIPKDGVLGLRGTSDFPRPKVIDTHLETVRKLMTFNQEAGQAIFKSLSSALRMESSESFQAFHRPGFSSPDILRLLRYQPQDVQEKGSPQRAHTDLGSLTFLFAKQPGLQILPQGADEWEWVVPKPHHAIINLGDGMSLMSNGLLHSCLHRVIRMESEVSKPRFSFAYMLRAEDRTPMKGLKSLVIPKGDCSAEAPTSAEWLETKFSMLRKSTYNKSQDWVVTGVSA